MGVKFKRWLFATLHGALLLLFSWIWISFYSAYGDEQFLIKWASTIKRTILQIDEDPKSSEYLFINLAYDKELIASEEVLGKEVITDRSQLAAFFNILKKNQNAYKFTLCDVYLAGESPNDSLLTSAVMGLKKTIFPIHSFDEDSIEIPKFPVEYAIADYKSIEDAFLKFRFVQEEKYPSIPVYMHHALNGGNVKEHPLYYTDNGKLIFNSFIVDFPVRSFEVFENEEYTVVNLADLLVLPEEVLVNEYLKDRILLMGDFDSDVHYTIYGDTPGTLILLNTYLTLKNGHHIVSVFWVLMMLFFFTLLSYHLFYPKETESRIHKNRRYSFVASFFNYLLVLSIISILSYLIFQVYVNILILVIYINLVSFLLGLRRKTRRLPKWNDLVIEIKDIYLQFK
jgi:hypothetical protein